VLNTSQAAFASAEVTDRAPASDLPTPDMLTGKKMAFNDVLQSADDEPEG